jgi:hypothetical protein
MDDRALLEISLERVAERIGDPVPRVYEALFAAEPQLREMFVGDPTGSVRGEMFHRVVTPCATSPRTSPMPAA